MATKNKPGNYDCYANAEADEPMFVLLARDELAPNIVRAWAFARNNDWEGALAALSFVAMEAKHKGLPDNMKLVEALVCADSMEQWQLGLKWATECDAARKYKVIDVDNYDRDYQTEYFVCGPYSKEECNHIALVANNYEHGPDGSNPSRYFTTVPETRKLYVFEGY